MSRTLFRCTVLVCLLSTVPALNGQEPRLLGAEHEAPRVSPLAQPGASLARLMKFSGELKNADGSGRTGVQGLTFALYRNEQDGSPLWMEPLNAEADSEFALSAHFVVSCISPGRKRPQRRICQLAALGVL